MSLYLAIDAGGTKTQCLLADDTRVLARASTGTVKLMRVSEEEATGRMQALLDQVASLAGTSLERVTRTCLGLAGFTSPEARAWARQIVPAIVSGEFLLCGDEEIAIEAAFQGGPGILIIAGTGSHVLGRSASGALASAGGWGPVIGDEGSGYWIGLQAVRSALRAFDEVDPSPSGRGRNSPPGPSSPLLREILKHWKLKTVADLVELGNRRADPDRPVPDFADLAPSVATCAQRGDALAAGVLERAGEELADHVTLVARKLSLTPPKPGDPPVAVAFTGSVLSSIEPVRAAMIARLAVSLPSAKVQTVPVDPLDGALWRARRG